MLASPFGATLSRMVRRNWEYKAMKLRVLKFVKSEGDNRESYTFLRVVPGQRKKRKRLLVPGTLASLIILCPGTTRRNRSEEHTSELHHVAISYAVFCLK